MGGNLVRRWPSGAVLNRVVYAQLHADPTADHARICMMSGREGQRTARAANSRFR